MYYLKQLGTIEQNKDRVRVMINNEYHNALKNLVEFSHIHIFYTVNKGDRNDCELYTQICKIESVNEKKGSIILSETWCEFIQKIRISKVNVASKQNIGDLELIDIKPYFPSDDRVLDQTQTNSDNQLNDNHFKNNQLSNRALPITWNQDEGMYDIQAVGMIRNTHDQIFIELQNDIEIDSEYIKVFWWFNKFDSKKYRRTTQCIPPYENSPKMGVFATRSPVRPNPLAMTIVKVVKADRELHRIYINEIESFDQTPCLGIMEYRSEDCITDSKVPQWLSHWSDHYVDGKQDKVQLKDKQISAQENQPEDNNDDNKKDNHEFQQRSQIDNKIQIYNRKYDIKRRSRLEELLNESSDSINNLRKKETDKPVQVDLKNENIDMTNQQRLDRQDQLDKQVKKDNAIVVIGARENNLRGINVSIPYGKISAVVGVSGSGKSSLVHDTIYAECLRRMEYLSSNHNILQKPQVDTITGCIPAVIISQEPIRVNVQSTVGTYTNVYDHLRILYANIGIRHCSECGREIIPLTMKHITDLLYQQEEVSICTLNKEVIIHLVKTQQNGNISDHDDMNDRMAQEEYFNMLQDNVRYAINQGNGAFYAKINEEYIMLQTRQACYHCRKQMFELTPTTFSYLDPECRCQVCNGTGHVVKVDESKLIDKPELSLLDGASSFYGKLRNFLKNPNANWMKGQVIGLAERMNENLEKSWNELSEEFKDKLLHGDEEVVHFIYDNRKNGRKGEIERPVEGLCQIIERVHNENGGSAMTDRYLKTVSCQACNGERLNNEGRLVTINQVRYPEAASMTFDEVFVFCENLQRSLDSKQYEKVRITIQALKEIAESAMKLGIGYLKLDRGTSMISGGEGQRLKLLAALLNQMSGILYIFDEPSKGLHPKDYSKVIDLIRYLRNHGNTILMVEHNEDMIRIADRVIEVGPGAGQQGGRLVGEGSLQAMLRHNGTQISKYMNSNNRPIVYCKKDKQQLQYITMDHLCYRNLQDISIRFPKEALTCICGVSGSGKSSLMKGEILLKCKDFKKEFSSVVLVDQLPIGKTSKSIIATYCKVMDEIRQIMAHTIDANDKQFDERYFSFNGELGRCPRCEGDGMIKVKFLENVYVSCPDCHGTRYKKEVLGITYHDKNISEILNLSVEEAIQFFSDIAKIADKLKILQDVGLGYAKIGQSTQSLSGGEASRLKLATELFSGNKGKTLYLLDEPTTGLHFSDIEHLLKLFDNMIKEGNTVVVIEHNKQVLEACDYKIELGPGAGTQGGRVMKQG